jgi:CHASE2 domain-containing sensor protein
MSKLVVFELGEGDFEQGFPVTLRITGDGKYSEIKITGKLPPEPQVEESYVLWQSRYRRLRSPMRLEDDNTQVTNIGNNPIDECKEAGEILSSTFNNWLKSSSFSAIREKFLQTNKLDEEIRIILQTDDYLLRKLPWGEWDLLTDYKNAEIAFSPRDYEGKIVTNAKKKRKIKILAILGDSKNIDVEKDRGIFKEQLPDAKIDFLVKPTIKQIDDKLREQSWDILFFAGHSESQGDSSQGWIKINDKNSLSLRDLRSTLNKAIEQGLSLAIFNSCDGLGLAVELSAMQIPQMIVMRESIPDVVAHEFLKYFLKAFARSNSLYLAVREARERLQILEKGLEKDLDKQFPCASWLPVIFQNPAYQPFIWVPHKYTPKWQTVIPASIAVAALVLGVRHLGWLQTAELKAYDQMMQLRPEEQLDSRILVVKVTEDDIRDDINTPDQKKRGWFSLSDAKLVRVINEINKHQPRVIGLDNYRNLPTGAKPNAELEKLFQENENLFAVCEVTNKEKGNLVGTPPAPFIPPENLGFSDVVNDSPSNNREQTKIIRRHLLYMNPDSSSSCKADYSFNLLLAEHYLLYPQKNYPQKNNIQIKKISDKEFYLGKAHFKKLPSNAGGYQGLDSRGFQILLNYRNHENFANSITVTDLLGGVSRDYIKGKIILIGVTAPSRPDDFQTPYGTPIRGVFLHAQMVSQIISAALGERPLLGVWAWWADGLWICGWSFVGGLIVWRIWGAIPLGIAMTVAIVMLSGSCFLLFVQGNYWVPFVPSLLTLVSSGGILICYSIYKKSTINT